MPGHPQPLTPFFALVSLLTGVMRKGAASSYRRNDPVFARFTSAWRRPWGDRGCSSRVLLFAPAASASQLKQTRGTVGQVKMKQEL